jgi:two-component system CheB/CheR fusion protein
VLKNAGNHDFSDYKLGTIERRIAQRMAAGGFRQDEGERYVEQLKGDPTEVTVLANELLINVTSFFRDPDVFKLLVEKTIPEMVSRYTTGHVLRVWAAGCSTGEEAYSLAMVFLEHLTSISSNIRLQIFATDADPEAIAFAREGLYSDAIVATLPPDRLKRFFEHEEGGYRVSAVLRACLVFSVHDLLTDPPFARIDFISCRNVLIYLSPEAQARIIAVFHFALSESGLLLLGSVETTGVGDEQFEIVARKERLWRRAGKK